MDTIKVNTKALQYIKVAYIAFSKYENGSDYIGIFDRTGELYTDISTYIMPVFPGTFYVEKGSESEKFCQEQDKLFTCLETEIKQGFNRYILYKTEEKNNG